MSQERGEGGLFVSKIDDSDVIRALQEHPEPVATTRDLADRLSVTTETVRQRLTGLHEKDRVAKKRVAASGVVWWLPTEEATHRREQAFEEFARRVTNALGEEIYEIILYGSTARGEATETSDVDVLLVTEGTAEEDHRKTVSRLAFDIGLEYDVAISYHFQSKDRFESRQDSPFLTSVLSEGRSYG